MTKIPALVDFADADFDPFISDELAFGDARDPYPKLAEIAAKGPVQEGELRVLYGLQPDMTLGDVPTFMVLGTEEIKEVLGNAELFSNDYFQRNLALTFGARSLSALNPPEHPRYRRIFQKAFLPHVVGEWTHEFVDPVINGLIDRFVSRGRAELMSEFVFPYPFEIIYRQLRLPAGDEKLFHKLAVAQTLFMVDLAHGEEAGQKLGTYFQAMLNARRQDPGTDLVSVLAQVEVDGEHLPDDVIISFLRQLINAAGDTTYRSTGNLLVALLVKRPDQLELIKQDRSLIAKAIEETLRWEGPVNMAVRIAMEDTVLAGVPIPKGSALQAIMVSANRDPERFPDPEKFDMFRSNSSRHMAFAAGPHICVGQHLARLEMTRALNALLDRLPNLRLDPDYPEPEIRGHSMRVPREIHVLFD